MSDGRTVNHCPYCGSCLTTAESAYPQARRCPDCKLAFYYALSVPIPVLGDVATKECLTMISDINHG